MRAQQGNALRRLRNLVREPLFRYLLDLEVEKAIRLQYCVSVVCLTPDLPEGAVDPALTRHVVRVAMTRLRRTDLATILAGDGAALLLIDADTRALPGILDRTANLMEAGGRRFARGDLQVSVSAGGGCYPETATGGTELFRQARSLMARARREGGDRLYLPPLTMA
jgi:GGDEF domain-containing protein